MKRKINRAIVKIFTWVWRECDQCNNEYRFCKMWEVSKLLKSRSYGDSEFWYVCTTCAPDKEDVKNILNPRSCWKNNAK